MNPVTAVALVWTVVAAVIAGAVWKLARDRRGDAPVSGGYVARHRAHGMSTMERGRRWAAAAAWAVELEHVELIAPVGMAPTVEAVTMPRPAVPRLPRPRSPWNTPEWVDEWTAEHEPALPGSRAAA